MKNLGFIAEISKLKKLWPFLRPMKKNLYLALVLVPIIFLLQMVNPLVVKRAIDQGILAKNYSVLTQYVIIYFILSALDYLSKTGQALITSLSVHKMIRDLRLYLIGHILQLRLSYHDKTPSGTLVTRATSDFDNLSESLNQGLLTTVVDISVIIGSFVGLFILRHEFSYVLLALMPLLLFVMRIFTRILKKTILATRTKIGILNSYAQECFYGFTTVKVLSAENFSHNHYKQLNKDYRSVQMQNVMADSAVFAFLDGFSTLTVGIMFAILATNWLKIDGLTAGVLIAFVQYLDQIYDPIKQLGNKMATLQGVFAAIDRIFLIIDRDDVIRGTQDFTAQSMAIQFNNVSFSYFPTQEKNNEKLVLKNINFSMPEGQSLALVGPTGSGKSSVIKLLTKLYDGYAGHIFIGDQDLKDISPQSWVKNFAYVPQDPAIFNASIEYNIALGRPGITTQDIYESLKVVGLFDFVQSLPEGIGFILNEGGHNLSQGQRQLIAFARAIVTHPKLIILDEATASVDQESEKLIENATNEIFKGRSVVVIAHRLATIERADQIIVIKNGEIIQNKEEYYSGFSKEKSS